MTNNIESLKNDIIKLENMINILDNTENLYGSLYSDILSKINQAKQELNNIIK